MADRSAGRGYLGELGRRLQRLLGFDGEPGASFSAEAIPVMLVGDATLPGYGEQQGRRFAIVGGVVAAVDMLWIRAESDCIIEAAAVTRSTLGAAATDIIFRQGAIGIADPFALTKGFCFWLDRNLGAGDKPPLVAATGAVAAGASTTIFQRDMLASDSEVLLRTVPFCLAAGQALVITGFPAGGAAAMVYGRTV